MLDVVEIEGVDCFGFEVSAKKFGDNPDDYIYRVWFSVETRLPVRIEFERLDGEELKIKVTDRFEWDVELDESLFVPEIPDGFSQSDRR
jgi:outer membrane lipoprotein-sorting protein